MMHKPITPRSLTPLFQDEFMLIIPLIFFFDHLIV